MNNDNVTSEENKQPVETLEPVESLTVEPTPATPVEPAVAPAPAPVEPVVAPAPAPVEPAVAPAPAPVEPVVAPAPAPVEPAVAPAPATVTPVVTPAPATIEPTIVTPETPQASITIGGDKVETKSTEEKKDDGVIKAKGSNKKLIYMLILIVILAAVFVWLLKKKNAQDTPKVTTTPQVTAPSLMEDVKISGHACSTYNSVTQCTITIGTEEESVDYALEVTNKDLFLVLSDYKKYIKVNVSYNEKGTSKTIVDFKLYLKSTNEEISNTITEKELREKLKLFNEGEYTETLTLTTIGSSGVGMTDDETYSYTSYIFTDSNNNEYEMKYKNPPSKLKLTEGKQYTVNFEVKKDSDYEFNIKSIK